MDATTNGHELTACAGLHGRGRWLSSPSRQPAIKRRCSLLKQARAYGVGITLATQNPVDLDYKALSNIGTWFLGKLQTERDKARVLDGLEGLAGGLDRQTMDKALSTLRGCS